MYRIYRTKDFERSSERLKASGTFGSQTQENLTAAINVLATGKSLPAKFKDHALKGKYAGYRECHIRGDLLLVYQRDEAAKTLDLVNIGSHSQLFG